MRKIASLFLVFAIAAGLTACDRGLSPDSGDSHYSASDTGISDNNSTSESSGTPDSSNTPDEPNRADAAVNIAREEYNITLPIISADEALELEKIDLPEQIDGHYVNLGQLIDDDNFIVYLIDREGANGVYRGAGLYSVSTGEFRALNGLPTDGICAWNSDYIVYKEYDSDFTKPAEDESVKLFLYDISARENRLIYTYSFDRETEIYESHWKNNIALKDNKIYFDDIIGEAEERRVFLFSYDISAGELERLKDDAQNPIVYKDTLLYIKTKDGNFELESLNGRYSFEMNGHIQNIAALGDDIFSLDVISNDDEKRETTWGIKNMLTGEYILKTTRTISELAGNDSLMAFKDWGINCPPVVYNSADNTFIVFDEFVEPEVYWFFSGNAGVIRTIGQDPVTYLFKTALRANL